jgi:hypothetical protein
MKTLLMNMGDVVKTALTFSDLRQSSSKQRRKVKKFYTGRVKVDYKIPVTPFHK